MFDTIISALFNATLTGAGVAIGTFLAQRGFLSHLEKILAKAKEVKKR